MKTQILNHYPDKNHRIEITRYCKDGSERPYQVEITHYQTAAMERVSQIWGEVMNGH